MNKKSRKPKPLLKRVHEFIKKKKRVRTQEIYSRFHNEPKSSIRRILHTLNNECVIYQIKEWRSC